MKITESQLDLLRSLKCEQLSANPANFEMSLWENAIGFRQEVTYKLGIWRLCLGCWKVTN